MILWIVTKLVSPAGLHLTSMAQKLLIIDTDCGIDDALAIIIALAAPNVKVLGITCCFGNTDVDNVCQNVLQVLSVCEQPQVSPIPIKSAYWCFKTNTQCGVMCCSPSDSGLQRVCRPSSQSCEVFKRSLWHRWIGRCPGEQRIRDLEESDTTRASCSCYDKTDK